MHCILLLLGRSLSCRWNLGGRCFARIDNRRENNNLPSTGDFWMLSRSSSLPFFYCIKIWCYNHCWRKLNIGKLGNSKQCEGKVRLIIINTKRNNVFPVKLKVLITWIWLEDIDSLIFELSSHQAPVSLEHLKKFILHYSICPAVFEIKVLWNKQVRKKLWNQSIHLTLLSDLPHWIRI